ncbi:MAG TPA: hypothetical protein VJU59_12275 [Paraburkholderia sp.]|uniref:hypothetical protein n=1 Tax=Paraburkholderia sp. TaxID=1926495 RepID=UPI002B4928DA|nr:hypothetical protein [Paraburkholderia sp.]HKR40434.1 hypothetical protein [Paraburkholderia sp.]
MLANGARIVTALALDASSETRVIASMLDQSARVTGAQAEEVLLDAGYFDDGVIGVTPARDVSLLCSQGQWPSGPKEGGLYHKNALDYDELTDSYRCGDCHLRANCTKVAHGRRIKRYPEDEQREALRMVTQHPQARRIFG